MQLLNPSNKPMSARCDADGQMKVVASGVTLSAGDITLDVSGVESRLDDLINKVNTPWHYIGDFTSTDAGPADMKNAGGGSEYLFLTGLQINHNSNSAADVLVTIKSDASTVWRQTVHLSNGVNPIPFVGVLACGFEAVLSITLDSQMGSAHMYVNAQGYTSPSPHV